MTSARHTSSSPASVPQSLKLTDYLRPVFQEAHLVREYCQFAQLQQSQELETGSSENLSGGHRMLTGMYVIPSAQSHFLWFGVICVNNERGFSPWHGGVFRFFLRFPDNYPSAMPAVTFLPTSCTTHPLTTQPQYATLSTHPDISPNGNFNLRAYVTSATLSTSSSVPRVYRILKLVRKAFYRHFNDVDVGGSVNPSAAEMSRADYAEFLRNCAIEAEESVRFLRETDKYVTGKFKGDANLILLSSSGGNGGGENLENGVDESRNRTVGLSFM